MFLIDPLLMDLADHMPKPGMRQCSRLLTASAACSEEQIKVVVQHAMAEAQRPSEGLYFDDFRKILARSPLTMDVDLPSDV